MMKDLDSVASESKEQAALGGQGDKAGKPTRRLAGWQWLLYIDFVLPAIIYAVALSPLMIRFQAARIFHNYLLYLLYPWPDFRSLTGIAAPLLHLFFLLEGFRHRKKSSIITAFLFWLVLVLLFNYKINGVAINYYLLRFIDFGLF